MEGTLEQLNDGWWQLRFVRRLHHAPEKVWQALVDPEPMSAWMPARMEGDRAPGAPLKFVFEEAPEYDSRGEMRVVEPPRLLEYTWEDEVLRFELRPVDGGCELTFLTRFEEVGKAARDAAGWHVCLDHLVGSLDGEEPREPPAEHGRRLRERYRQAFPTEASALGPPEWHPESQRAD